jgi:hypothetical protein
MTTVTRLLTTSLTVPAYTRLRTVTAHDDHRTLLSRVTRAIAPPPIAMGALGVGNDTTEVSDVDVDDVGVGAIVLAFGGVLLLGIDVDNNADDDEIDTDIDDDGDVDVAPPTLAARPVLVAVAAVALDMFARFLGLRERQDLK